MWQPLLIVWRESVEALLVVSILYAWLIKQQATRQLFVLLWGGAVAGIALSTVMALLFVLAGEWLSGSGGEWFQTGMLLVASLLIMQMVVWMHQHGHSLKQQIEQQAARAVSGWGIFLLVMLAVAREGSETVIFLFGIGNQQQGGQLWWFTLGSVLGLILAGGTFYLLQLSQRILSWRRFFHISEVVLLLLGGALLMAALDKASGQLMAQEFPEWIYRLIGDPLWDSSRWLPDSGTLGSTIASLTGYRAMPTLAGVILLPLYWLLALGWMNRGISADSAGLQKQGSTL